MAQMTQMAPGGASRAVNASEEPRTTGVHRWRRWSIAPSGASGPSTFCFANPASILRGFRQKAPTIQAAARLAQARSTGSPSRARPRGSWTSPRDCLPRASTRELRW